MDTNKNPNPSADKSGATAVLSPEIPEFRVNKPQKRRGMGVPWLPMAAPGKALTLAAVMGSKAGMAAFMSVFLAAAVGIGTSMKPDYSKHVAKKKPAAIAARSAAEPYAYTGDLSALPSDMRYGGGGLGMGGKLGMSPEEAAAAKAAEEAAAAKAAEEAAAAEKAAAAEGAEGAENAEGAEAVDPAAMMAAAGAGQAEEEGNKSLRGKKIGGLSTSLGNRGGLSGGIGGSFGGAKKLSGPPQKAPSSGQLSQFRHKAKATRSKGRASKVGRSRHGRALGQLERANQFSQAATRSGTNEGGSQDASSAFDNLGPGGTSIGGTGVLNGPEGAQDANPPPNQPGTGSGGGGSATTSGTSCGSGTHLEGAVCLADPPGQDKDPTTALVTVAQILVYLAIALLIIAALFRDSLVGTWFAEALAAIVMCIGAAIAVLGIAMIAMGRPIMGAAYTIVGAAAIAMAAIMGDELAEIEFMGILAASLVGVALPMLAGSISKREWDADKGEWTGG